MSLVIGVYLAGVIILAYVGFSEYCGRVRTARRLELVTLFMSYLEHEKHRLPTDIQFNYEACRVAAMKLMEKQK